MTVEMKIMRGPNIWSPEHHRLIVLKPGLEAVNRIDREFVCNTLITLFPRLDKNIGEINRDTITSAPLFITRMLALIGLELQAIHVPQLTYYMAHILGDNAFYSVFEYRDEEHGKKAAAIAGDILSALVKGQRYFSLHTDLEILWDIYLENRDGPSTNEIVEAAKARNIPVKKIGEGRYILFGHGKFKKRISASICEDTGMIAVRIAGDKAITKQILSEAMLPVPSGLEISKESELRQAVDEIGFPLVTKPYNGHQGKNITTNIKDYKSLLEGFEIAKDYSRYVIVEKYIKGKDYRFLIINYKMVAAACRYPALVVGDGRSTIRELIKKVNDDPLRGEGHGSILTKIEVDEITKRILREKNLTLDSIPETGRQLVLKDTANLSTGGTAVDVTDEVHPYNKSFAERAARAIGLDVCGIDIISSDIKTPFSEGGGVIIEVNAAPGLRMHVAPASGTPRKVGKAIIEMMFPNNISGRIPIISVTGTNGKTTTTRLMAHVVKAQGFLTGFTSTEGIYLDGMQIVKGDCTGPRSADVILEDASVEFAVLECARGGILRSGLAFDECDIGIVTNVAADHLGLKDIITVEDMARVKSVVPRSVKENGYAILNAMNEFTLKMAGDLKCKVALFSLDPDNIHIKEHCANGGLAAVKGVNGNIIILDGSEEIIIENVNNIPVTMNGKAGFMIENVLPVVIAAYVLKFSQAKTQNALRSFYPSEEQAPGRLNIIEINNVHVMVDYAHNPHGIRAFAEFIKKINEPKTGIITGVGDRRSEDIIEVGRLSALIYDEIIIRIDGDTRGRKPEEIIALLKKGINSANPAIPVKVIPDTKEAVLYALRHSRPGSYIVVSADYAQSTLKIVNDIKENFNLII